jgi:hypothetical protein
LFHDYEIKNIKKIKIGLINMTNIDIHFINNQVYEMYDFVLAI